MKRLPLLLALTVAAFAGLTLWAMTIDGILEPASLDVDYYYCGAGDNLLLLRGLLVLVASGLALSWAFHQGNAMARLARLAIIPCLFLMFSWSVSSLDRSTPGFSEDKFLEVLWAQRGGKVFTLAQVRDRLGPPLMTAEGESGKLLWSYTFTPSGGFGWRKRVLTFDSRGVLQDVVHFDEP